MNANRDWTWTRPRDAVRTLRRRVARARDSPRGSRAAARDYDGSTGLWMARIPFCAGPPKYLAKGFLEMEGFTDIQFAPY